MNEPKCPGCKERDERIGELEEENAELLSKLEQIIAPVEVGGGIEAVLRTRVKELEGELRIERGWQGLCEAARRERDQLRADLATVAPVVRAAAMQVEARDAWTALIDSAASAAYYDACEATEGAVRALPADLRERLMASERMGVDRE